MPSVMFWPGQPGGTAQYRCHTPGEALRRLGWDVTYVDALDVTVDGRIRDDPDILVVSRIISAYLPDALRRITRRGRTLVVYDIDDWFDDIPAYNPASRAVADPVDNLEAMHGAMAAADLITCSTPELAGGYARFGPTVVLPNYLDPDVWTGNDKYRQPRVHVHVGWMGAFHWRGGDVALLRSWLPAFLHDRDDVRFVAVGCPELLDYLGVDGLTTPRRPGARPGINENLRPYEHLPAMLASIDVGLVPLARNRFNQAKSWCKGLEYNAMGIPAVASPSREYRRFIQPGVNGYLARDDQWRRAVTRAIDRLDELRVGASRTAAEYFIDDRIHLWVDAYAEARTFSTC